LSAEFSCKVTAAFLEAGRTLGHAANVAALIAGLGCWWMRGISLIFLFLSLIAWTVETWFAVRVSIDRSLFRTLAEHPEDGGEKLDALLVEWRVLKQARPRSLEERSLGARRLLRKQSWAFGAQLGTLGCTAILGLVGV
jgi:hypothetical protein